MILFLVILLSVLLVTGIIFGLFIGGKMADNQDDDERENNDF